MYRWFMGECVIGGVLQCGLEKAKGMESGSDPSKPRKPDYNLRFSSVL